MTFIDFARNVFHNEIEHDTLPFRNLDRQAQDDLTSRYDELCVHYGDWLSRSCVPVTVVSPRAATSGVAEGKARSSPPMAEPGFGPGNEDSQFAGREASDRPR
jgi:hypothetical protein